MAYQSEIEKLEQRYREKPEQWFAALADAYRKAGEVERAVDIVRAGLEKRPNYTSGHIVLGRCLLDQLADDEAMAAFERVLQLDAENIIALKSLSEIAERKSDPAGACRWLERLLDVDPMNEEAREALKALRRSGADALERTDKRPALADVAGPVETASDSMDDIVRESEFPVGDAGLGGDAPPSGWDEIGTGARSVDHVLADEPFGFGGVPVPAARDEPAADPSGPSFEPEEPSTEDEEGSIQADTLPQAVRPEELLEGLVVERASESEEGTTMADAVSAPAEEDESEGPTIEMAPLTPPAGFTPASVELADEELLLEEAPGVEPPESQEPAVADEPVAADFDVRPFDEELAWDAGERLSHEITAEVIEEAKQAHEEALEPPAHYLPGLERADVPAVDPSHGGDEMDDEEADDEVEYAAHPSGDLPLIMPEDYDAEPPAGVDNADGGESVPEPVVTETMAEVYARQGLFGEASEIYRELLAQRPGDPVLERRLAELTAKTTPAAVVPREARDLRFAASRTGGLSVRWLFHEIVTGEPAPEGAASGARADQDDWPVTELPPTRPAPEPVDLGPMEADPFEPPASLTVEPAEPPRAPEPPPSTAFHDAFGAEDETGPEPERDASGSPAQPAGDEVSLASVFGEEPAPSRRPPGDAARRPPSPQAASYDDFFTGDDEGGTPPPPEGEGKHDGDDGDTEFRAWLEGLKT